MLRITLYERCGQVDMKLEGNLTGVWVSELEHSWRAVDQTLAGRRLLVDLAGVSYVDKAGEYLLALLRGCGAELKASGVAMTEMVRCIACGWPLNQGTEPGAEQRKSA
jgi:anti-anti-sigma regulatory factor